MRLDDIHREWAADSALAVSEELDREASRTPQLHAKYSRYLSDERMALVNLEIESEKLTQDKTDWLTGVMPEEDMRARGWEPELRRVLTKDVDKRLQVDDDVVNMRKRMAVQREKVDALVSIVKMIMNRNFVVKNMIDWVKFKSGVN